jgi:serine protease Do
MLKQTSVVIVAAVIGGLIAIIGYDAIKQDAVSYTSIQERQKDQAPLPQQASYSDLVPPNLDFTEISKTAIQSVVHITSAYANSSMSQYLNQGGVPRSSGSGVIISDDGFIITNNHVVEQATEILVTLNDNRSYEAKVIGKDPQTDLALLKIQENNLPFMTYGDSDGVEIGQWVLAVGNPLSLNSTVTAGILSAKARNIGILDIDKDLQIEAFLQTDAVVNPGNSGGALIDIQGKLIGINTAIQTTNGLYQGYSFAVPVNLVKKVADDLLEFGVVQRGLLGIRIGDVNAALSERFNLGVVKGVYVGDVNSGSAAEEAGIEQGDVIIGINNKEVDNTSELQELVARQRPGDEILVRYVREQKEYEITAVLKNTGGTTTIVERVADTEIEGTLFEEISSEEQERLSIDGGVKIKDLRPGKWEDAGMQEGFIITEIDKFSIKSVDDLQVAMAHKNNERVVILGLYPDGTKSYYTLDW